MRIQRIAGIFGLGLLSSLALATASRADQPAAFKTEMRIYLVRADITGNGLTSQTMPGVNGSYQIVHEKLGNVELAMEGKTLTWNGAPEPNDSKIVAVAAPSLLTEEGKEAMIVMGAEGHGTQYFAPCEDGHYELKTIGRSESPQELGLTVSLTPRRAADRAEELACDFAFGKTWIREREKIDGVSLDVGKPIFGEIAVKGKLGARLGEWVCYQTSAESEGMLYLFIRISEEPSSALGK